MKSLENIKDIEKAISNEAVLLYITAPNCNVCEALKSKIKELFKSNFPKVLLYEADIAKVPEISSRFNIFSAPLMMLFFDGQEFVREGRNVSLSILKERVEKVYNLYFKDD